MRTKFLFFSVLSLVLAIQGYAQEAVTTEELTKYATAMDSVNEMQANVKIMMTDMVKANGKISGKRYNELSKIIADEAKLAEAQATPEEIAFVKEVAAKRDEQAAKINQALQTLAKDYVGGATYNKVKKALSTDTELKTKYDSLMAELAKDNPGATNSGTK